MRGFQSGHLTQKRKGVSTIVGAMIVFGMVLTVMYGYFYIINQDQQLYLQSTLQNNYNAHLSNNEYMVITGSLIAAAIGFNVTNMGIATTIVGFFVIDTSSGKVITYNSGIHSNPPLPIALSQGQSTTVNTGVLYTAGKSYMIKVLTSRGYTAVGTYPPRQLPTKALGSLVAAGLGSLSMQFSSYNFYGYTSTKAPYVIDINHPHSGSLLPYGQDIALSVQITNNDPNFGTIVIGPHTNLWTYQQCQNGCGSAPVLSFFAVNVATNGTITSTAQYSFTPIKIPYGATQTIYFASSYDLSLNSFQLMQISGNAQRVGEGEYAVFLIASGTITTSQNSTGYSQNLPYAASYVTDNQAWFSETPVSCSTGSKTSFSLTIINSNSQFSTGSIKAVSLNASWFSSLQASSLRLPQNWTASISNGIITWSSSNKGGYISPGSSITLPWNGTAPSTVGVQATFPFTITWSSGVITVQQSAVGCYVS